MIRRFGGVLAVIVCLLLLSAPAYAANLYKVELIVFRNLQAPSRSHPLPPIIPNTSNAVGLNNQTALQNDGIQVSAGGLSGIWRALNNSAHYHPMLRVSWTQSGRSPSNATSLRLHNAHSYTLETSLDKIKKAYQLDGTATLLTQPRLHLRLNLVVLQPGKSHSGQPSSLKDIGSNNTSNLTAAGNNNSSPLVAYHLHANQKLKVGNIRYFDNPGFGVIAKVTQVP